MAVAPGRATMDEEEYEEEDYNETANIALATGILATQATLGEGGLEVEEEKWCSCNCFSQESDSEEEEEGRSGYTSGSGGYAPGRPSYDPVDKDPASQILAGPGPTRKVLFEMGQPDGLTQYQVTVYMITAFIGVAVLVLPSLMRLGGWIVTPCLSAFIAFSFLGMVKTMCESLDACQRQIEGEAIEKAMGEKQDEAAERKTISTFEDVGRRALGMCGVGLIRSTTLPGMICGVLVFSLLIANNVRTLSGKTASHWQAMLYASPLLLIFAIMPNNILTKAMNIGMYVSILSCTLICVKSLLDSKNWADWPEIEHEHLHSLWPQDVVSLGTVLAVLMSSYSLMATVPTVRAQMQNPEDFYPGYRNATIVVLVVYLAVMGCAYYGYGNYVSSNIVESMVFPIHRGCPMNVTTVHCNDIRMLEGTDAVTGSPLGLFMTILTTIDLFLGFALIFKCASGMIVKFFGENECSKSGSCLNNLLRSGICCCVVAAAIFVPSFRDILAIRAAICCPTNNIFYPLAFNWNLTKQRYGICRMVFYTFMVVFGIGCFVLGLYHAISNLALGNYD